jgi:hypothetical protein
MRAAHQPHGVIPAKAGISVYGAAIANGDSRFRGNDIEFVEGVSLG